VAAGSQREVGPRLSEQTWLLRKRGCGFFEQTRQHKGGLTAQADPEAVGRGAACTLYTSR